MTQTQTIDPDTGEIRSAASTGRVTIDDVRAAIGDTDPDRIGASRVRTMLGGRGSHETIQRHLATLRAEAQARAAPPDPTAERVPVPPQDAVTHIWAAAWHAARAAALARAELLAAERDAALARIRALESDIADQAQALDSQAEQIAQAAAAVAQAEAVQAEAVQRVAAAQAEAAQSRAELVQVQAQAAHAAELAGAGMAVMRSEMERMSDQVSELKAALYHRAQQPQSSA